MNRSPAQMVLWSDEVLLAVNKPPGLPTVHSQHSPGLSVPDLLQPLFGRLWVVHRLDRDTSGLLLLARSPDAHQALSLQFRDRTVEKVYHALVRGQPPWGEQTVEMALRPDGDRRHRTVTSERGARPVAAKPAITQLRVLERLGQYTLVEAVPQTGRTHQIRAHLAALGFPIVADVLYGGEAGPFVSDIKPGRYKGASAERPLLARPALHALAMQFEHPQTKERLWLRAPYSKDLTAAVRQLRRYSVGASGD